jgi:lipoprotein NlpI
LDGALADINTAIQLAPESRSILLALGYLHYDRHEYPEALKLLRKGYSPGTQDYIPIRICLTRARLGETQAATEELRSYLDSLPSTNNWRAVVGNFLIGRISEKAFLEAAQNPEPPEDSKQEAAWFYAGTMRLLKADRKTAEQYFQKCANGGPHYFTEVMSSKAELQFLAKSPSVGTP